MSKSEEWNNRIPGEVSSWMKWISDDTSVTKLTIPGTHDSVATNENYAGDFGGQIWTNTQIEVVARQLDEGVRFLDARIGKNLQMCHGEMTMKSTLDGFLKDVRNFLRDHPSETVLVSVMPQYAPEDFNDIMEAKWKAEGWWSGTDWPKLGEVRGKAVLLRRFGSWDMNFGIYFAGIQNQKENYYGQGDFDQQDGGDEAGSGYTYHEKWERCWRQMEKARNAPIDDNRMHFTQHADSVWKRTPWNYAWELNPSLMRFLSEEANNLSPSSQRLGTLILDFCVTKHALKILSKNWEQKVLEPGNFQVYGSDSPIVTFSNNINVKFQRDSNLVVYHGDKAVWAAEVGDPNANNPCLTFQSDNNLVIYNGGNATWHTNTDSGNHRDIPSCRLRFMSGPPFIMIDTKEALGDIYWTTWGDKQLDIGKNLP